MAKKIRRYSWGGILLAVVAALGAAWWSPLGERTTAEGAITLADATQRVLTVGPIELTDGMSAQSHLLLPAVQKAMARVWVLDGEGNVLHVQDYPGAPRTEAVALPPFRSLKFDITVGEEGVVYGDGSVRTVIDKFDGNAEVAVLIGLLLPAVQKVRSAAHRADMGTLKIVETDEVGTPTSTEYLTYTLEDCLISGYN